MLEKGALRGWYHMAQELRARRMARHEQEREQRRETIVAALAMALIMALYALAGTIEYASLYHG